MASGTIQKNMVLLWENSSPDSSFNAQKVTVDLSKYDAVLIAVRCNTNNSYGYANAKNRLICFMGETVSLFALTSIVPVGLNSENAYMATREATVAADGITFTTGYWKLLSNNSVATADAGTCIPLKIYGIKA